MLELKEKISQTIEKEWGAYQKCNQAYIIKRITKYLNCEFLDRNGEAEGLIFWDLGNERVIHFAKNIDLDTKDLQPYGMGEANEWQNWILKLKFKKWLKENHFSLTLNDLSELTSAYGSSVWKKYWDEEKKEYSILQCDLSRLAFDEKARSIRKTPIIEKHYLSETEIRAKEGVWDNIDDIIKFAKKVSSQGVKLDESQENYGKYYEISERIGEVFDKKGNVHYVHYIVAGKGDNEVIAYEEEIDPKDNPYYDFHIGAYKGLWLRRGVIQRLFQLQERANTVVNENAEATAIASLLLMRSNDPNTHGNVLQGAISGQIINSQDLQQIGIDNRAFNILLGELDRIEKKADALCFTPAVVTGDMLPSKVPFRGMAQLSNAAKSAFQYIRESIGESISNLLTEEILPSLVKNWNKGDIIEIVNDFGDIKRFDEFVIKQKQLEVLKSNLSQGVITTQEDLDRIASEVSKGLETTGRKVDIPKKFFNFDIGIYLNVVGESVDKSQQNDAYANIINMIMANPAIQSNPYFRQWVENNGITPVFMTSSEINDQSEMLKNNATGQEVKPTAQQLSSMVNA